MKYLMPFSLLIALPLFSQTPTLSTPSCPVSIRDVRPNGSGMDAFSSVMNSANNRPERIPPFRLKIQNDSGKDIKGIKFGAAYYDSVEDPLVIPVDWNLYNLIGAGKSAAAAWDNTVWHSTAAIGWIVWPTKILFTDGTRWEISENTIQCNGTYWKDKKGHPLAAKPSLLTQAPETASKR